jgi:hypothetical protein
MRRLLMLGLLCLACGGDEEAPPADVTDGAPPVDTIAPVDSVGIEMGDSCYVLGSITDAEAVPEGGLVVLDRVTCKVTVYDGDGLFVTRFGGKGEAPDHFQWPTALAVLGDGRIAVKDGMGGDIALFTPDGDLLGRLPGDARVEPSWNMEALGDSALLVYSCPSRMVEGSFRQGYQLSLVPTEADAQPRTLFSHTYVVGEGEFDFRPGYICVAAGDGTVFLHRMASEDYLIEVMDGFGGSLDTIRSESRAMPLDSIGFGRQHMIPVARFANTDGSGNTTQSAGTPPESVPQVLEMGTDSSGNLWAMRGTAPDFRFDVFSPGGEKLREVVAVGLPDSAWLSFDVGPGGVLAWDISPEDYPRVYRLGAR